MPHRFVPTGEFQPNNRDWATLGGVVSFRQDGNVLRLETAGGLAVQVSFLGPRCFRVRFNPVPAPDYTREHSYAVVSHDLGPLDLKVHDAGDHLLADTGATQVRLDRGSFRVCVFRGGQLICADEEKYNLVYIPGASVIANFKTYPANARYCGFGEKAGTSLFKNQTTMTFFNYDNYAYAALGRGGTGDPTDPSLPLYCSIPLLLEVNPKPVGPYAGAAYCYGIFFDNPSQSFFNIGYTDYGRSMVGKYYFGALYGEMDYYFLAGDDCRQVLEQYTTLTGRAPMPPRYVFGYHQGAYGYYDHHKLRAAANGHRANRIPLDGLHIDIDFQNNYRVFTSSAKKFPNAAQLFQDLKANGFKCSTNITAVVKFHASDSGELDEDGQPSAYAQRDALKAAAALIPNQLEGDPSSGANYLGRCTYGRVTNPYPAPPLLRNPDGSYDAHVDGWYPDICRTDVRHVWGEQYRHLIQDLRLDMIWQDMQCPAVNQSAQPKTLPLELLQDRGDGVRVPHVMIHNVFGLNMLAATWEGLARLRKGAGQNVRNFIIARGGYAGMQRYAGLWTGDCPASRRYLATLIPQALNIGLSGVPISGSDVGGFATGDDSVGPDSHQVTHYVVFVRWLQISAFLTWFRNHYSAYSKEFQEVYRYAEPVPTYCQQVIELRYRLIPLFYDAMYEWTQSGLPVCRPLFLNDSQRDGPYDHADDEFFVGNDFLVAPIVPALGPEGLAEEASRDVYLPAGGPWFAFKDNLAPLDPPVAGDTLLTGATAWRARLDQIPIYVRAGAIIPMRTRAEQYVGELGVNPLTINVYPGPDRSHRMYLDDGLSLDAAEKKAYREVEVAQQTAAAGRTVRVRRLFDQYAPPEPYFRLALLGMPRPTSVTLNGQALPDAGGDMNLSASRGDAYYWDATTEITLVKVLDRHASAVVVVS